MITEDQAHGDVTDEPTHVELVAPSSLSPGRRAFETVVRSREASILLVLVVVIVAATIKSPDFLFSSNSWRDLLLAPSVLLLLAAGQTVVIITRNVDLSVGSILGLTAYLTGRLFVDTGLPIVGVVVVAILVGALLGLVNGLLIGFGRVPALVITLGTLYIYRGAVLSWAGSDRINASDLPDAFSSLGTKTVLSIPVLFLVAMLVIVVVGYYLHTARGGRELYAIGSDPDAAVLYGLRVRRRVIGAFVLSGTLAGASRRRLHRALRHGELRSRAPASSCRPSRAVVDRRRGDLRRQRHRLGRRDRRAAPGHDQPGAADPRHPRLLAAGAGRRADPAARSCSTA